MMTAWRLRNSKERRKGREEEGGERGNVQRARLGPSQYRGEREEHILPPWHCPTVTCPWSRRIRAANSASWRDTQTETHNHKE